MVDLMPLPIPDADRPKMLRYEQMERLRTAFVDEMPRLLSATGAVTTSGKLPSDAAIAVSVAIHLARLMLLRSSSNMEPTCFV
jgi:hypothetical protein